MDECGKLDLNNVSLKKPNKLKRNTTHTGFLRSLFGSSMDKEVQNPKYLREKYAKIMEDYNKTSS